MPSQRDNDVQDAAQWVMSLNFEGLDIDHLHHRINVLRKLQLAEPSLMATCGDFFCRNHVKK